MGQGPRRCCPLPHRLAKKLRWSSTCCMVICSRRYAKLTLGRPATVRWGAGLTDPDAGSTVELAVVTTFSAGKSRLWPTAFLLTAAVAPASTAGGADLDD